MSDDDKINIIIDSLEKNALSKYNQEKLYKDLRCKLVHSYSEGGSYLFTDGKSNLHMKPDSSGKIIINLEDFINDIEQALNNYKSKLLNKKNSSERAKAINRFDNNGIIRILNGFVQLPSINTITSSVSGNSK